MSRKYRHRGYQDEERGERRPRQAPPQQERREGPRGRGLGAPTLTVFRCARCGAKQTLTGPVTPLAVCGSCGADLHTCTNCLHFDTSAPNECRQPVERAVARKASRNECPLFTPKVTAESGASAAETRSPDDPRAAFDALFKV